MSLACPMLPTVPGHPQTCRHPPRCPQSTPALSPCPPALQVSREAVVGRPGDIGVPGATRVQGCQLSPGALCPLCPRCPHISAPSTPAGPCWSPSPREVRPRGGWVPLPPWGLGGHPCLRAPLTPLSPDLAVLLFPAMSMLSVGGILLILTNMQVSFGTPGAPRLALGTPVSWRRVSPPGGQPLWEVPLHRYHPLQRGLRLLLCHLPHHKGGRGALREDRARPGHSHGHGDGWDAAGDTARAVTPCACPQVLYERGLPLQAMFLFMAACSAWHLLRTLFLMPRTRIPYPLPPNYNYG